ncbi:MAG: lipopolysaccharide heptosyltransferase II [Candidatus Omnitrophica bacterium]|nr:lipopolysaccharide heptosyltransferase II [Candidatus Omnitrophota bacterium]
MSKKIIIARLDRIGDVVLSTPVIKALRDAYPDSHIAMMVRPYAREIVEGNPYLNEVIIYDKDRDHKGIAGHYKFIQELREKKFDIAIILHPTNRTHLILKLAGIPERIGYDKKAGFLLTKPIPHTKQFGMKHEIDYTLGILRYIGIEPSSRSLYMPTNALCERKIEGIFKENRVKDSEIIIAISPGASCASKRWSVEKFADVANGLVERYGARIIIIAGNVDKHFGDRLASLITAGCINLSGKTGIGDIASLLRRARLFISNDSGPVHIGCAVGTPVIAIFGRSDRGLSPERWGPSGKHDQALHKSAGCYVCYAHNCKVGFKCLDSISAEEVLEAAEKILGTGKDE